MKKQFLLLFILFSFSSFGQGYLHRNRQKIEDGNGKNIVLRGLGLGGCDIINEPNWNFDGANLNGCDDTSNVPLRDLQVRVTKAIREVDANHLIFIEGNCWGNNL